MMPWTRFRVAVVIGVLGAAAAVGVTFAVGGTVVVTRPEALAEPQGTQVQAAAAVVDEATAFPPAAMTAAAMLDGAVRYCDAVVDGRVRGRYTQVSYGDDGRASREEGAFSAAFAGDCVRYTHEANREPGRTGRAAEEQYIAYSDGKAVYRLYPDDRTMDIYDPRTGAPTIRTTLALPHRFADAELHAWQKMLRERPESVVARVEAAGEGHAGEMVLTLQRAEALGHAEQYWIAPAKGYALTRWTSLGDSQVNKTVEIELRPDSKQRWVPSTMTIAKSKRTAVLGRLRPQYDLTISYESVELNSGAPPVDLPIEVPAGTEIMDNRTGTRYQSEVAQVITESTLGSLTGERVVQRPAVASAGPRAWRVLSSLLVLGGILLSLLLWIALRRIKAAR